MSSAVGSASISAAGMSGSSTPGSSRHDSLQCSSRVSVVALGEAWTSACEFGRRGTTLAGMVVYRAVMARVLVGGLGEGRGGKQGQPAFGLDQPSSPCGGWVGVPVAFRPASQDEPLGEDQHVEPGMLALRPNDIGGRRHPVQRHGPCRLLLSQKILLPISLSLARARERETRIFVVIRVRSADSGVMDV